MFIWGMITHLLLQVCFDRFYKENKAYAFGKNANGQLGLGNNSEQITPKEITFFRDKNIRKICLGPFFTYVLCILKFTKI